MAGVETDHLSGAVEAEATNGDNNHSSHNSSKHKRRKETEEERRIRKEKEREHYKKHGKRPETEEERQLRKEKERREREERHGRVETEEERLIRKEKRREERRAKEGCGEEIEQERRKSGEGHHRKERKDEKRHRRETEEERRIRKEKQRRERKSEAHIKREEDDGCHDEEADVRNGEEEYTEYEDVKQEPHSEDEKPLAKKSSRGSKRKSYADDEEDAYSPSKKKRKLKVEPQADFKPAKTTKQMKVSDVKREPGTTRKVKKEEEEATVWKWWEEDKKDDGKKWYFLEHKGPLFPDPYKPLPKSVRFYYDGRAMRLSPDAEEIATFYGRMLDHDYTSKEVFNKNFFKDWRKNMNEDEKQTIRDLSKCDFTEIDAYFKKMSEERKARSKEEKKAEKEKNEAIQKEYGFCTIDGHREKMGNFRIEPPSLFRGRGEHPKQGVLKRRVRPEEVTINCSKDSKIPEPPEGCSWKEVRHDNTVTWLASWTENVQNQIKYVMLNPSSKLKGEKDMMKYEKARQLKLKIDKIRTDYTANFKSKEMRIRQRAVALYFIDKLALRAGNEKDEDQADTVGCCSLRVEHIRLYQEKDGKENVVEFDFLGKDSIRYNNEVEVEKRVFKNVQLFMDNKKPGDDLFDRLSASVLNEYLNGLMPGLTAKVFRTYNASITLQQQLEELTDESDNVVAKVLSYNRANRAVAVLCNHQRAVPKTYDKSMANLQGKIDTKKEAIDKAEKEFKDAKKAYKGGNGDKGVMEKKKTAVERLMEQLNKLETQAVDKEENKTIALGTSKLNYLDPRISVAWCKKYEVPIEKVYNKTQREKFRWAIDMAGPDYVF